MGLRYFRLLQTNVERKCFQELAARKLPSFRILAGICLELEHIDKNGRQNYRQEIIKMIDSGNRRNSTVASASQRREGLQVLSSSIYVRTQTGSTKSLTIPGGKTRHDFV